MASRYLLQGGFVDGVDGVQREPEALFNSEDLIESGPSTFHPFPKLPLELRGRILKMALDNATGNLVLVHPNKYDGAIYPPLLRASYETRILAKSVYDLHQGSQIGKSFAAYINLSKDSLYINCNFRVKGRRFTSGLHATIHAYPQMLVRVERLFMNLPEMTKLTSAYRITENSTEPGLWDLWEILDSECPNLIYLVAVLNGPFHNCSGLKLEQLSNEQKRYWSRFTSPAADIMEDYFLLKWTLRTAQGDGLCQGVRLGQSIEPYTWKGFYQKTETL